MSASLRCRYGLVGPALLLCGCPHPVVVGGKVAFNIYRAPKTEASLLAEHSSSQEHSKLIARSEPVDRAVVIPRYELPPRGETQEFFPARLVKGPKKVVHYRRELRMAFRSGEGFDTYPIGRRDMSAWVFCEGCWPVYAEERGGTYLMTGGIRTRWQSEQHAPWGYEGTAVVVCFRDTRPWDREVAAGAGIVGFVHYLEGHQYPGTAGDPAKTTLEAMSAIPCWFMGALDQAKELTDRDRVMVYRQVLAMYENTKALWVEPEEAAAYEKNTAMLRERIRAIEKRAPVPADTRPAGGSGPVG